MESAIQGSFRRFGVLADFRYPMGIRLEVIPVVVG